MSETEGTPAGLGAMLTVESPVDAPTTTEDDDRKRRRRIIALIVLLIALLLLGALFAWYLITRKPITAIPGLVVTQTPRYAYSLENQASPLGIAVTSDGERIYVAHDVANAPVTVLDRAGQKVGELKFPTGMEKAPIHTADYVAVSPVNGTVYVSDRLAKAVYVYDSDGNYQKTIAPTDLKKTWQPLAITVGPDGTIYVADVRDKGAQQIVALDDNGAVTRTFTIQAKDAPALNYPNGLTVNADGSLIVADSNSGRVLRFGTDGKPTVLVSSGVAVGDVGMPRGLLLDDHGRLMVVDTVNGVVNVYSIDDPNAKAGYIGSWGQVGVGDGQFEYPNSITQDARAKFYVTDRVNNRIQVWSY